MKIVELIASCGRTIPHPSIDFASIKCDVSARATLGEGDEDDDALARLQSLQAWVTDACKTKIWAERKEILDETRERARAGLGPSSTPPPKGG